MQTPPKPIAFEITRVGQKSEEISPDSLEKTTDNPAKYVFPKAGTIVRDFFVHALETEPKPIYPRTPEQKKKWREFVRKNNEAMRTPNLRRA